MFQLCADHDMNELSIMVRFLRTLTTEQKLLYHFAVLALQAAVQESAKIAADALQNEMNGEERALAKICPRVAELASRLLQRDDNACVSRFAALSEVQRLSAAVYSCGPAL